MIYYSKEHEWLVCAGDVAKIGITQHAAEALGDIVFIEVKEIGTELESGSVAAVIESVKAASEIYAPVAGTVIAANSTAVDDPAIVNSSPEGDGWLLKVRLTDPAELENLLDRAAYDAFVATL